MGACYPLETKRFYYRDRIARLYEKYIGPWPDECQWVTDHETVYWLDEHYADESSPYFGFIWDQNGLANLLSGHFSSIDGKTKIPPMQKAAAGHAIQRFLQLARETDTQAASRSYVGSLWASLDKDPHSMTLDELLELERKLDKEERQTDTDQ